MWLLIGALAGWLAGTLVRGGGFGLLGDIVVGILGACLGGWLVGLAGLHVGDGLVASLVTAALGAVLLISLLRLLRRG